jgi:hypothetical protein
MVEKRNLETSRLGTLAPLRFSFFVLVLGKATW